MNDMPAINISPVVRFVLYVLSALALIVVAYAVDKSWAGDAEVKLVTGIAAIISALAAAKTPIHVVGEDESIQRVFRSSDEEDYYDGVGE